MSLWNTNDTVGQCRMARLTQLYPVLTLRSPSATKHTAALLLSRVQSAHHGEWETLLTEFRDPRNKRWTTQSHQSLHQSDNQDPRWVLENCKTTPPQGPRQRHPLPIHRQRHTFQIQHRTEVGRRLGKIGTPLPHGPTQPKCPEHYHEGGQTTYLEPPCRLRDGPVGDYNDPHSQLHSRPRGRTSVATVVSPLGHRSCASCGRANMGTTNLHTNPQSRGGAWGNKTHRPLRHTI